MLFSNKFGYLYIHIAKTGGTSIKSALKTLRKRDPLSWPQLLCYNVSGAFDHKLGVKPPRHTRVVGAKEILPRELFDQLFKFCLVRNPFDIQVSAYHHMQKEWPEVLEQNGLTDFASFVRWSLDPERPYSYAVDPLNQRLLDYMSDVDGTFLMNYVGAFENLQEGWHFICQHLGLPKLELPQKRVSKGRSRDFRGYYDTPTTEVVARHYQRDLDAFGYTFDCKQPSGPRLGLQR